MEETATVAVTTTGINPIQTQSSRPRKPCFSFAAYAKTIITHLQNCNIHITDGLTDSEFTAIESNLGCTFPPDLRSILREGLPFGPGFPNWRCSSPQQLQLLTSLPVLELYKEVSRNNFWAQSWGPRPNINDEAVAFANRILNQAPILVPIYRYCYIPSRPCLAGNPVFYVQGGDVRILSFDVGGFFQEVEFWRKDWVIRPAGLCEMKKVDAWPAWAATAAREVDFWSDLSEDSTRGGTRRGWWSKELNGCLEDVMWKLRVGGWREEEVREMMMMDGCDDEIKRVKHVGLKDKESVIKHARTLSRELLRGGWSIDDVVYSLGKDDHGEIESGILEEESWVDLVCK